MKNMLINLSEFQRIARFKRSNLIKKQRRGKLLCQTTKLLRKMRHFAKEPKQIKALDKIKKHQ